MRHVLLTALLVTTAIVPVAQNAPRNDQSATSGELKLGEVHFPVSCAPEAQGQFNRAVAILHSFWYDEAVKAFAAVTEKDPGCAMGFWGVAMSYWYPLWYPPGEAALKAGSSAVAKAQSVGGKTERERAYIEAIASFYRDSDKLNNRTRSVAYEKAMEGLYRGYPDDREAAVFYALSLDATAVPTDKTYANQKQAAQILQKVFLEQPNHPGVAHYLIHSYDSAPLADLGLPAAICYSKIAPSVPHALHMPSHIFTRLGKWQDSIDSNRESAEAGQDYASREFGSGVAWDQSLHAMDYLEYAYLQTGRDGEAKQVMDQIVAFQKATPEVMTSAYALAAIPARYAVERRDWPLAASVALPPLAFPWNAFPWTTAMITYARALGAARIGDLSGAASEIAHLQSARDALIEKNKYWSDQIEVQRRAASAMLARAQDRNDEALALLQSAADLDASMDKHPVTPGAIVPTRELLGDLLLELDQPAKALAAYELSLTNDPNRFRSIYGAAKAADRSGDRVKARTYYQQLALLGSHADTQRPELVEAKAYVGQ